MSLSIEVGHKHNADLPAMEDGKHLWIVMAMFHITDPTGDAFTLDHENLMTLEGPGCYLCEQVYSPQVAAQPCPGEPVE